MHTCCKEFTRHQRYHCYFQPDLCCYYQQRSCYVDSNQTCTHACTFRCVGLKMRWSQALRWHVVISSKQEASSPECHETQIWSQWCRGVMIFTGYTDKTATWTQEFKTCIPLLFACKQTCSVSIFGDKVKVNEVLEMQVFIIQSWFIYVHVADLRIPENKGVVYDMSLCLIQLWACAHTLIVLI